VIEPGGTCQLGIVVIGVDTRPYVPFLFRPPAWQASFLNYVSYTDEREKFMVSPHARAALLSSGILWCLCIDSLGIDTALNGPSSEAFSLGRYFKDSNGKEVWDDYLSEDEEVLLIGMYGKATGVFYFDFFLSLGCDMYLYITGLCLQVAQISWWPKPEAFLKGSLYTGYWGPQAESWFQKQKQDILKGVVRPLSAREWKDNMHFSASKTHHLFNNTKDVATRFLTGTRFP